MTQISTGGRKAEKNHINIKCHFNRSHNGINQVAEILLFKKWDRTDRSNNAHE